MRSGNKMMDAIMILFFAVFAMPFFGGYLLLEQKKEMKVLGSVLCVAGLFSWFVFGLR